MSCFCFFQKHGVRDFATTHCTSESELRVMQGNLLNHYITQTVHCHESHNVENQLHAHFYIYQNVLFTVLHVSKQ
jgi:hypothetical protein